MEKRVVYAEQYFFGFKSTPSQECANPTLVKYNEQFKEFINTEGIALYHKGIGWKKKYENLNYNGDDKDSYLSLYVVSKPYFF